MQDLSRRTLLKAVPSTGALIALAGTVSPLALIAPAHAATYEADQWRAVDKAVAVANSFGPFATRVASALGQSVADMRTPGQIAQDDGVIDQQYVVPAKAAINELPTRKPGGTGYSVNNSGDPPGWENKDNKSTAYDSAHELFSGALALARSWNEPDFRKLVRDLGNGAGSADLHLTRASNTDAGLLLGSMAMFFRAEAFRLLALSASSVPDATRPWTDIRAEFRDLGGRLLAEQSRVGGEVATATSVYGGVASVGMTAASNTLVGRAIALASGTREYKLAWSLDEGNDPFAVSVNVDGTVTVTWTPLRPADGRDLSLPTMIEATFNESAYSPAGATNGALHNKTLDDIKKDYKAWSTSINRYSYGTILRVCAEYAAVLNRSVGEIIRRTLNAT